jgi:hypothetical protein
MNSGDRLLNSRYFLKIVNLKSPITDNKFREGASPFYLLFVIGDLRFVIFQDPL